MAPFNHITGMALKGIQVLEMPGLAPGPFCGMILSDFGAKVIRIDKASDRNSLKIDSVDHGKYSLALNMKSPKGIDVIKRLAKTSDVIIDPFRPGVMEKLGLGPLDLQKNNQGLIYARLSGFGQSGPLVNKAGHDINFASMSGLLSMLGWNNKAPSPSLNVLGDFAGGGLTCAFGIVMALLDREKTGKGQIVDCSMTRGVSYLSSWIFRSKNSFLWSNERGKNILDGGFYNYETYETKDGKWMAVGSLEEKFYNELLKGLNISIDDLPYGSDNDLGKKILKECFLEHPQKYWIDVFSKLDACVTPILTVEEAASNEHNTSQNAYQRSVDGCLVPTPEPRMSRTPGKSKTFFHPPRSGQHTYVVLKENGFSNDEIKALINEKIVHTAKPKAVSKL